MDGGNGGLNTVVPFADDNYANARKKLRISADKVHRLGDELGLHPSMKSAKALSLTTVCFRLCRALAIPTRTDRTFAACGFGKRPALMMTSTIRKAGWAKPWIIQALPEPKTASTSGHKRLLFLYGADDPTPCRLRKPKICNWRMSILRPPRFWHKVQRLNSLFPSKSCLLMPRRKKWATTRQRQAKQASRERYWVRNCS